MHSIGEISVNASLLIYFIWFVPQLVLNAKRRDTEGLSMLMHALLCVGYSADLMYGFGRHMQWQYRAVTVIGLISLTIQHYQFGRYGLHSHREKGSYIAISLIFIGLFCYAIYNIDATHRSKQFYDLAGVVSSTCWFTYMLPQIIKNFMNKSTKGLSMQFVVLSLLLSVCDIISAWTLGWDYPSKIGAPLTLVKKSILLGQGVYYGRRGKKLAGC